MTPSRAGPLEGIISLFMENRPACECSRSLCVFFRSLKEATVDLQWNIPLYDDELSFFKTWGCALQRCISGSRLLTQRVRRYLLKKRVLKPALIEQALDRLWEGAPPSLARAPG